MKIITSKLMDSNRLQSSWAQIVGSSSQSIWPHATNLIIVQFYVQTNVCMGMFPTQLFCCQCSSCMSKARLYDIVEDNTNLEMAANCRMDHHHVHFFCCLPLATIEKTNESATSSTASTRSKEAAMLNVGGDLPLLHPCHSPWLCLTHVAASTTSD